MRLKSGSIMVRAVVEDCTIAFPTGRGYKFRKGDHLAIFPPTSHFDPEIFHNPHEFVYDRFLSSPSSVTKNGKTVPFSQVYMPFGGGSSYCPGRKFARNEVKTIAAYLLWMFDLGFEDPASARASINDIDSSRAGLGIFPPKNESLMLRVSRKH